MRSLASRVMYTSLHSHAATHPLRSETVRPSEQLPAHSSALLTKVPAAKEAPALEIRFGALDLAQVRIQSTDPGAILDELTGRVATAPRFFQRTAVGLDLGKLDKEPAPEEIRAVIDAVRRAGMLPVGLVQGPPWAEALARALDMPVLSPFRAPSKPPPTVQAADPAEAAPMALMHESPVRSGQRVYGRQRDVIVTAPVGAGAEVMADGSVHIYGALRGRVMAGAHGDTAARVFCQEFFPELVSIAGVFRVFETLPDDLVGKPVQAWLVGDVLKFARIG
jgi:septum site-determining protein MinC